METINVLDQGYVKLIGFAGSDERVIEAARRSHDSGLRDPERDYQLIEKLLRLEHLTPFEHCVATFDVKAPIFVRSQWFRHRAFSYSEVSRRYVGGDVEVYWPSYIRDDSGNPLQNQEVADILQTAYRVSVNAYERLLELGVAKELARTVLPQGAYTKFFVTGDLRNWMHFLKLRLSHNAQYEFRVYADAIYTLLSKVFPYTMSAFAKLYLGNSMP